MVRRLTARGFEVERSYSLRKCIRPLSGELFSGHLMMIRACRSFKMPRSLETRLSVQVFRHAVGLFFRLLLTSADLGRAFQDSSSWRWESGKRFVLSKRSVFSTASIRLRPSAAVGADSLCHWIVPPMRCEQVYWRSRPRLYSVAHAGQADAPTVRNLQCHT